MFWYLPLCSTNILVLAAEQLFQINHFFKQKVAELYMDISSFQTMGAYVHTLILQCLDKFKVQIKGEDKLMKAACQKILKLNFFLILTKMHKTMEKEISH